VVGVSLAFAGGSGAKAPPYKVGFVFIDPLTDYGWTHQHNVGRLYLQSHLKGVETMYLAAVPAANGAAAMEQLIHKGAKLIFATSFDYGNAVLKEAKLHPDVLFEHATGYQRLKNISTYYLEHWEASYLQGILAGKLTKKNVLAYVASFPLPEVVRDVNAYTLGAQSVNPKVKVKVVFINSWFDPPKEKTTAR